MWLGARNGRSVYRNEDKGYNFGSSIDDRDFADHNHVLNNTFSGASRSIRDDGSQNQTQRPQ